MGAPCPAVEELQTELGPRGHAHHQVVVEHRQPRPLQYDPADFRLDMGTLVIPAPRADHVPSPDQLHASTPQHLDLATDQPVDNEKTTMVSVWLLRSGDIPSARRKVADPCPGLATGSLALIIGQQIAELRIGVDDADRIRGRVQLVASPAESAGARPSLAYGRT